MEILKVKLNSEFYGFEAGNIEQILEIPPITPVPLTGREILGVCVIAGKIINVIDINQIINNFQSNITKDSRILKLFNKDIAFLVDSIEAIIEVKEENLEENGDIISHFYKENNDVVMILDIEKILKKTIIEEYTPIKIDKIEQDTQNLKSNDEFKRVLFFKAGGENFAIDIEILREIIYVSEITPISNSDILGVITLRDKVLNVIDINEILGFSKNEITDKSRILVAIDEKKAIALLVDEVEAVKNIEVNLIENINVSEELIEGVYKGEKIYSIISTSFIRNLIDKYYTEEENVEIHKESNVSEIAVFKIDNEEFAFDIEDVQEIIKYDEITPIPDAPEFIEGILNLRGQVIPIMSLPKRLNFEEKIDDKTKIIVCLIKDERIGFIVDDVIEILFVEDKYISKAKSEDALFDEVINLEDRVILKIKVENLLDEESLEEIKLIKE